MDSSARGGPIVTDMHPEIWMMDHLHDSLSDCTSLLYLQSESTVRYLLTTAVEDYSDYSRIVRVGYVYSISTSSGFDRIILKRNVR